MAAAEFQLRYDADRKVATAVGVLADVAGRADIVSRQDLDRMMIGTTYLMTRTTKVMLVRITSVSLNQTGDVGTVLWSAALPGAERKTGETINLRTIASTPLRCSSDTATLAEIYALYRPKISLAIEYQTFDLSDAAFGCPRTNLQGVQLAGQ